MSFHGVWAKLALLFLSYTGWKENAVPILWWFLHMCNLECDSKLKLFMGLVCKGSLSCQFWRINIQILNVWKITPRPVLWHVKHWNLPSLMAAYLWLRRFTRGINYFRPRQQWCLWEPLVLLPGWGNKSEPKWLPILTLLFCTMYQCVCSPSTSRMRIQLQKRVSLDTLFSSDILRTLRKKVYIF